MKGMKQVVGWGNRIEAASIYPNAREQLRHSRNRRTVTLRKHIKIDCVSGPERSISVSYRLANQLTLGVNVDALTISVAVGINHGIERSRERACGGERITHDASICLGNRHRNRAVRREIKQLDKDDSDRIEYENVVEDTSA
jgi:hypothetical protein